MSSADGPGADPTGSGQANELQGVQVHAQLVEALIHLLIEKGVLTKNDALSVVQTAAQVQRGVAVEARNSGADTQANLRMLQDMYRSFEAVTDRARFRQAAFGNVHRLRPPIHDDQPEFPGED